MLFTIKKPVRTPQLATIIMTIALVITTVLIPGAAGADTLGQTFDVSTLSAHTWIINFNQTLDDIPFDLSFNVESAERRNDDSWDIKLKFSKRIDNPTNDPNILFNAGVQIFADGIYKTEFGPGSSTKVPVHGHVRHESSVVSINVPAGSSVHITSKNRRYDNGITSVGTSYFDFYLHAPRYYTVTFKDGLTGNTLAIEKVKDGAGAAAPNMPTHTGYTSDGWDRSFHRVTSNIDVTALYSPISYQVTFDANGGGGKMPIQKMTYDQEAALNRNAFSRTGYTWTGWSTKADGSGTAFHDGQAVKNLTATEGATITLYAKWKPNTYSIQFDANSGVGKMDAQDMTYDQSEQLSKCTFTRVGYTWTGWSTKADGSGTSYSDSQKVSNLTERNGGIVTLYAQWRPNHYKIVFDKHAPAATGSMSNQAMSYDVACALDACVFTWEGHVFKGWSSESSAAATSYTDRQVVKNLTADDNGTVTLHATWDITAYPVTFTDGLGHDIASERVPHNTSATEPEQPIRTGCTFNGWDVDFSHVTAPLTVHATWKPNNYVIQFDSNGGGGTMSNQSMTYDCADELDPCAFTKPGHTFQGWSLERDGAITYTDKQQVLNLTDVRDGVVTLFAVWDEDTEVCIAYAAADPDHSDVTRTCEHLTPASGEALGSTVQIADGYRLVGWFDAASNEPVGGNALFMPERSTSGLWKPASYEARIEPIAYTIHFNPEGGTGEMDDQQMLYDQSDELTSCAFTRPGYTFDGWATKAEGEPIYGDAERVVNLTDEENYVVELYAVWIENPDVTIDYIADDPEHSTPSVSSETVAPATGEAKGSSLAVADGYAFERWEDWAGTVVSEDPTIVPERGWKGLWRASEYTAYVAPISYTVAFDANGGTGKMDDQQMTYDAAQALRKNAFERPGYIFLGWNTAPDGSGTPFEDAQEVVNLTSEEGGKVVLYAQWAKRTLAVTFYDGQGHIIETDTVPYGGKATAPSEPVRDGYAFVGWDTDFGCVTKDIDVTAMWKPVSDAAIAAEAASGSSTGPASGGAAAAPAPLDQTGGPGRALGFAASALAAGTGSALALRRKRACDGRDEQ